MNLLQFWYSFFRGASLAELAARELAEAERALLEAHTGQEYAASVIAYNKARIKRLREFLVDIGEPK